MIERENETRSQQNFLNIIPRDNSWKDQISHRTSETRNLTDESYESNISSALSSSTLHATRGISYTGTRSRDRSVSSHRATTPISRRQMVNPSYQDYPVSSVLSSSIVRATRGNTNLVTRSRDRSVSSYRKDASTPKMNIYESFSDLTHLSYSNHLVRRKKNQKENRKDFYNISYSTELQSIGSDSDISDFTGCNFLRIPSRVNSKWDLDNTESKSFGFFDNVIETFFNNIIL